MLRSRRRAFVSVLLGFAAVLVVFVVTRPFDPTRTGLGRALHLRLGPLVANATRGHVEDPVRATKALLSSDDLLLSKEVASELTALLGSYLNATRDDAALGPLFAEVRSMNRAMTKHGEPFFFDAQPWRSKQPLLYAYYIEKRDLARTTGFDDEEVVFLWRVDTLNFAFDYLGYTHRDASAAIVLYDQTESFLIRDVLPALLEGEKVDLVDAESRDPKKAWQEDIEVRSARMVRESFEGAADREQLIRVGTLLARRRAIVTKWKADLATQQILLHEPQRLLPEADYFADLQYRVPSASRAEWDDIHAALASPAVQSVFETLRNRFASDVARHEVQHRLDAQRSKDCVWNAPCASLDIPGAIRTRVGPPAGTLALLGHMPARVRDETSAYLAQMAAPQGMPKMTLLSLLRSVLSRDAWGDAYSNATVVLLDALGDEFSLSDPSYPLVLAGTVQRAAASSLTVILFSKSDSELRSAAAHAWEKLYGRPLTHPEFSTRAQNKPWRH